jgi:hypothetical protein
MTLGGRFSWACRNRAQTVVFRTSTIACAACWAFAAILELRACFEAVTGLRLLISNSKDDPATTMVIPAETTCCAVQCSNRTKISFPYVRHVAPARNVKRA